MYYSSKIQISNSLLLSHVLARHYLFRNTFCKMCLPRYMYVLSLLYYRKSKIECGYFLIWDTKNCYNKQFFLDFSPLKIYFKSFVSTYYVLFPKSDQL